MKKTIFISILLILGYVLLYRGLLGGKQIKNTGARTNVSIPTNTPTPTPFFPYQIPTLPKAQSYRIVLIGDSMTKALGVNADTLRRQLIELYPQNEFVTYNYGASSKGILILPEILNKGLETEEGKLQPVLEQGFELIIIESFAYNPLSEYAPKEGLAKQEQTLDSSIKEIIKKRPQAVIILMTPIAPDPVMFAKGTYDLTQEERQKWVDERLAYINNFINYAQKRNLPLIDIYHKSLTEDGKANTNLINADDNIHPSSEGVAFVSREIAKYIYQEKIIPLDE